MLLGVVFLMSGLMGVNSFYLGSVTLVEELTGQLFQDYFYQLMFLFHLVVGLLIILPVLVFGALHLRNAWPRPNFRAKNAGVALYATIVVLLLSGLVLTRFDFFVLNDPDLRSIAYWLHVITPLVVIWLFVLHRLAGKRIRYKPGLMWAAAAIIFTSIALIPKMIGQEITPPVATAHASVQITNEPFFPALSKTPGNEYIPAETLMMDEYCSECHADSHEQWQHSAHRFSSFNNPAYRFSVMETRQLGMERHGNTHISRFCGGCHDPVPFFSGAYDDPEFGDLSDPLANAGITCTSCHAITSVDSPRGNADFTIAEPEHYPFTFSDNKALQWVNRQLIKAKPAFHKQTFLEPVHQTSEFCGSCHKVHLPPELNEYKWLRGQNHFDTYELSGVSGHGITSFYYPPKAKHNCNGCHMPLNASEDFGAAFFDDSGELKIHNHQFPSANTAIPFLMGSPEWVNEAHRDFLEGSLRVDIFGIKEGGDVSGELTAPLRPEIPALQPGKRYLMETVLRTLTLGHPFTQGTADSNEIWLEVTLKSGDRVIGHSGLQQDDGTVDPWSHFVNVYMLDRNGNRIDRRNAQDIFTPLYNHQIPPGAADVIHYGFTVPDSLSGELTVEVQLNYRKFDTTYMKHFQGEDFDGNDLPITVIAKDSITFPVGTAATTTEPVAIPTWQRWNDYGIGLLRKGKRGELRQAEQAFTQVESLARPDGPLNLARLYLREGRLDDAADALRRAARSEPAAYPWSVAWFSALVNKQNGALDEAIAGFKQVLNTEFAEARKREFDFSEDYRVINELAQTLFERAKQERGERRKAEKERLLLESKEWFEKTLGFDPENAVAHYNLGLVYTLLGDQNKARHHQDQHAIYRPDDNARDQAINLHRNANPAADHAAEAVVIIDLQLEDDSRLDL